MSVGLKVDVGLQKSPSNSCLKGLLSSLVCWKSSESLPCPKAGMDGYATSEVVKRE